MARGRPTTPPEDPRAEAAQRKAERKQARLALSATMDANPGKLIRWPNGTRMGLDVSDEDGHVRRVLVDPIHRGDSLRLSALRVRVLYYAHGLAEDVRRKFPDAAEDPAQFVQMEVKFIRDVSYHNLDTARERVLNYVERWVPDVRDREAVKPDMGLIPEGEDPMGVSR